MSWLKDLRQAMKLVKDRRDRVTAMLTDDPISLEKIEQIAKNYDYHFEIIQPNGFILRFEKKTANSELTASGSW